MGRLALPPLEAAAVALVPAVVPVARAGPPLVSSARGVPTVMAPQTTALWHCPRCLVRPPRRSHAQTDAPARHTRTLAGSVGLAGLPLAELLLAALAARVVPRPICSSHETWAVHPPSRGGLCARPLRGTGW